MVLAWHTSCYYLYWRAVDSKQTGVIIQQNGGQGLEDLIKKGETYKYEKNG